MTARICPTCERAWPQRGARYCGACGASLRPPAGDASVQRGRRIRTVAVRASGVLGVALLFAIVTTLDLSRAPGEGSVALDDLEDVPEAVDSGTTQETGRLRCEPAGCQVWRIDRGGLGAGRGASLVGDDLIVMLDVAGSSLSADEQASTDPRLVALDVRTGEEAWDRPLSEELRAARIVEGTAGSALLVTDTVVTMADSNGELRWSAPVQAVPGERARIERVTAYDDAVVIAQQHDGADPRDLLRALDPRTGAELWSRRVPEVAAMDGDAIAVLDADRQLALLEPATGEQRWIRVGSEVAEVRLGGPWVLAQEAELFRLVHRVNGRLLTPIQGRALAGPMPIGDHWLVVVRDLDATNVVRWWEQEVGQLRAVAFEPGGDLARQIPLGMVRGWQGCCPIHQQPGGIVTIIDPGRVHEWDVAANELVRVARNTAADLEGASLPAALVGSDVSSPSPGVEVAVYRDGRRIDVRTGGGTVTVTSSAGLHLESYDPIVVSDGSQIMSVQPVGNTP